ncbi:MAG: type II secretion system F family protein [Candidatus Geothermincolales bacterium]
MLDLLFPPALGCSLFFLVAHKGIVSRQKAIIERALGIDDRERGKAGRVDGLGNRILAGLRPIAKDRLGNGKGDPRKTMSSKKAKTMGKMAIIAVFSLALARIPFPLNLVGLAVIATAYKRIPMIIAKNRKRRRLLAMASEIPEMVDLLSVLCLSGMSIQASFRDLPDCLQNPDLGELVSSVVEQQKLGEAFPDSLEAFKRHELQELQRVARTLIRAEEQGVAVSELLESLAREMKSKRRTRMRERAARASLAVLFPLVFLILPSFLILTLGGVILGFINRGP